ncbi:hypothetical protein EST38_g1852 [Candolleomyces aberdarensis]|uniref:Homeobox domain-containing protein n=1 Tax=Candolleomyces aberdarensis TaxID=2316362 RepID=A0A4Q2DUE9_9AGAR|nr:hypothetical protein EST38_g1852 [Candolleomyces aberdarensis]
MISKNHIPRIKERLSAQLASAKRQSVATERKRTPFNNEYTPVLEKYFDFNAYPSQRDRELLARKSMMTPRQIEVWNHRNRSKKEGRLLRRLTSNPLPVELPLDSLAKEMPWLAKPEDKVTSKATVASNCSPTRADPQHCKT